MPVTYVNARFLTQDVTGVQRFAQEISLELKRQTPDVRFLCPSNIKQVALAKALDAEPIGKRTGHLWEQLDLPFELRRRGSPLLINLMSTAPILYSNQIAALHDINFVRYPQSYSRLFGLTYRLLIPLILTRVKFLVTVSEFSKKEIASYYRFPEDRILVVPNAVNSALKAPATATHSRKYILAVSSPNYHKNFGRLVEAFNGLDISGEEDISLYVVGNRNGNFRAQGVEDAAADDRIEFLGRVDDKTLIELYEGALAFVFPSLYEGFGIPPLEAQANGCPVIASNAAAMPEVLGDSALYFDPTNVEDMRHALSEVIRDNALRDSLTRKGRANVAKYSWSKSAQLIANAIAK